MTHEGLGKMRTDMANRLGADVRAGAQAVDNILLHIYDAKRGEVQSLAMDRGPYKGEFDLGTPRGRAGLTEEWVAELAAKGGLENPSNARWYDRYVAAMTRLVRFVAGELGIDMKWTDVEMRNFLRQTFDYLKGSK
jgi:hypothetical protein